MTAAAKFTKADLKRAISAFVAAGVPMRKVEINPNGKIVILPGAANDKEDDGEWSDLE